MPPFDPAHPVLDLAESSTVLTQQICDIESVSGDEGILADAIVAALAGCAHLEIIRDGDTVVARTNLGRTERVVIAGHIDTVPINANVPSRYETHEGEDYLWGRGDRKSVV